MQTDKALLKLNGKLWLQVQVEMILQCSFIDHVVLVTQPEKTQLYTEALEKFHSIIKMLENPVKDSQPSDSIALALKMEDFPNGTFISPIDVPVRSQTLQNLFELINPTKLCLKPSYRGHGGHPVWLHPQALQLYRQQPRRLDEFISELGHESVQFVDIQDPETQTNLNTPEEWKNFVNHLKDYRDF
jgi:CTP:molybdopterin cytidylyltransferase MocA